MLPYKDMPLFPEKVTLSSNVIEIENVKMKRQRTTFQTKEQDKILGKTKNKKPIEIKMLTEPRKRIEDKVRTSTKN